jgi:hypothetical protein
LSEPFDLGRRFDLALCLEVAEHLDADAGAVLVDSLAAHSDAIFFSAACPGQPGQHHVNCQWPEYWQALFNARDFACSDAIRWRIWNDSRIEPWYRQNMFFAFRDCPSAGKEPRIAPVIHPEMKPIFEDVACERYRVAQVRGIARGSMPLTWYFSTAVTGLWGKLHRRTLSNS